MAGTYLTCSECLLFFSFRNAFNYVHYMYGFSLALLTLHFYNLIAHYRLWVKAIVYLSRAHFDAVWTNRDLI